MKTEITDIQYLNINIHFSELETKGKTLTAENKLPLSVFFFLNHVLTLEKITLH